MNIPIFLPDEKKQNWEDTDIFNDEKVICAFFHKNYSINMHSHSFYEINIVTHGQGRHYVVNSYTEVSRGYFFIVPPKTKHGYYNIHELDVFHMLISNKFFNKYEKELNLPGFSALFEIQPHLRKNGECQINFFIPEENLSAITGFLKNLTSLHLGTDVWDTLMLESLSLYIIQSLCKFASENKINHSFNRYTEDIFNAMEYIRENCETSIRLTDLCQKYSMSRTLFCSNFRKISNYTVSRYISHCRITRALRLLNNSNLSITEISQMCGFYDSSHFIETFKKQTGSSPEHYRKSHETTKYF